MNAGFSISVVIPTYNRVSVIERAINSVLSQTRPPDEIVIVDDGSTDQTRQTIEREFDGKLKYIFQRNRGVSCARNEGIKRATGNWIAFLDSDDEWKPEKLELQIAALINEPDFDFCHTNEIWIRNGKQVNAMSKHEKSGGFIFEKCLPLCVISPSSVLVKKSVFEDIGMFDEELPVCEDYDFWLRYCCSKPVLYIDKPLLVKYGGHTDQLSRKFWGMDRFRLHAMLNLVKKHDLSDHQENVVTRIFNQKYSILVNGALKHKNTGLLKSCQQMKKQMDIMALRKAYEDQAIEE